MNSKKSVYLHEKVIKENLFTGSFYIPSAVANASRPTMAGRHSIFHIPNTILKLKAKAVTSDALRLLRAGSLSTVAGRRVVSEGGRSDPKRNPCGGGGSRKCRPCKFALYYNRLQAKLFRLERLGERLYFSTPVNYFLEGRRFCVLVALSGPDIEMAHKFPDWTDIIIC